MLFMCVCVFFVVSNPLLKHQFNLVEELVTWWHTRDTGYDMHLCLFFTLEESEKREINQNPNTWLISFLK